MALSNLAPGSEDFWADNSLKNNLQNMGEASLERLRWRLHQDLVEHVATEQLEHTIKVARSAVPM